MSDELKASRLKADYAEKMLHTANRQLDELTRAHAEVLEILNDLLEEVAGCHYSCECINCHWARLAADRAEARLREVSDE